MVMIDSIEFDIRHPFSNVEVKVPWFTNDKMNEKIIASQKTKPLLLLARTKISIRLMKKKLLNMYEITRFYKTNRIKL